MDHVTLIGAETVERAGHNMSAAAREMTRAAEDIASALRRQREFMDAWLDRFEAVMAHQKAGG
jgi:hypothetical protein